MWSLTFIIMVSYCVIIYLNYLVMKWNAGYLPRSRHFEKVARKANRSEAMLSRAKASIALLFRPYTTSHSIQFIGSLHACRSPAFVACPKHLRHCHRSEGPKMIILIYAHASHFIYFFFKFLTHQQNASLAKLKYHFSLSAKYLFVS